MLETSFLSDRRGAVAPLFVLLLVPLIAIAGVAVDYSRAALNRSELQSLADGAVLAAAKEYAGTGETDGVESLVGRFVAVNKNRTNAPAMDGSPTLNDDGTEICIALVDSVPTTFLGVLSIETVPVEVSSCAAIAADEKIEVALVLDVSSSMIENDRFEPMLDAVDNFLEIFETDPTLSKRTKVSIVPFSSRVNIGLTHTSWLTTFDGGAAIPDRWVNPSTYYSNKYTKTYWIDSETFYMYNGKNYYWMGCIEPRSDVDIETNGDVDDLALSDATPTMAAFVAMDHNSGSGKSFCPPPIVGLSDDFAALRRAAAALTSEGSTRLDAGMVAGWYTLSPRWRGLWPDTAAPLDYDDEVHKIVVFMTDGQMNTQNKKNSSNFDWLCTYSQGEHCDKLANGHLDTICTSMKDEGIEIHTVSYDGSADKKNLARCASSASHFYTASRKSSSSDYIVKIYEDIAASIRNEILRLSS